MTKRILIAALYILSIPFSFVQAQDFNVREEGPINIGTTLLFESEILAEERRIVVSLPDDYESSSKRYPVIYLLDAQYFFQFQYAYGVINALGFIEEIPEVILVGIHSEDRVRDLTAESPTNVGGNADTFIAFISNELQVFVEQQYRTEPYKILIGHSAGGSFALHTLFHAPDTFNGYVAMSPALQWDNGTPFYGLRERLENGIELDNTLFTSIASEDGSMLEFYEDFLELLSVDRPVGLDVSRMSFPDEDHSSTTMPGIYHGILSMYENWVPSDSISTLEALLSHYRNLSEHYGYSVDVPVTHASDVGFRLIREGDPMGALRVFEYSLANISQDAIAHYQVGFALRQLGRLPEAVAEFEKAIELGPGTDMYTTFVRFRDEVAEEMGE